MLDTRSKVGDTLSVCGIIFTATGELMTWDNRAVRGIRWECGRIGYRVDESFESASGYRFECDGVHSSTFQKAAIRGLKRRAAEYRKALDTVAEYESPKLAGERAIVDKLI